MRLTCVLAFILALAIPCVAQKAASVCPLTVEQAPEVRGLKLGMEYETVKGELPLEGWARQILEFKEGDELGLRPLDLTRLIFYGRQHPSAPGEWVKRFEGVEGVNLQFLDDKLASIRILYDSSANWYDPLEFTAAIAKHLNLPRIGWQGRKPSFLDCAGFTVETMIEFRQPLLVIKLRGLEGELITRKYEIERKKREKFKP